MTLPVFDLPVIDFSANGARDGGLAKELMAAGRFPGFFYVVNHGIPAREIDQLMTVAAEYFGASEAAKLKWKNSSGDTGYTELRDERLSGKGNGDLKESFYFSEADLRKGNVPSELGDGKQVLLSIIERSRRVASEILRGFAEGLGLDPDYLDSKHTGERNRLRLVHYPAVKSEDSLDIRAGEHSDYGSITMLFVSPNEKGGLQVNVNGQWYDVPVVPYSIIINIGDALEFWTGGMLRSTKHRVVIPRSAEENRDRYSVPFFVQPDNEVVLDPLVETSPEFEEILRIKYPSGRPSTAGEHLQSRISSTYS